VHSWQKAKRGIPLAQAIQRCQAKGMHVGVQLSATEGPSAPSV
jgi:hypothetical protein